MAFNQFRSPKAWQLLVDHQTTFGGENLINIPTGQIAVFSQIINEGTDTIQVQLNKDPACIFYLYAGETQIFNADDVHITNYDFQQLTASGGGSADCIVSILAGVINA